MLSTCIAVLPTAAVSSTRPGAQPHARRMVRRRRWRRWWRRWWWRRWRLAHPHVVRHGRRRVLVIGDGERHRVCAAGAVCVRRVLLRRCLPVVEVPGVAADCAVRVAARAGKAADQVAAVRRERSHGRLVGRRRWWWWWWWW